MQSWKQQWCDLSVTDLAETLFIPDIRSLKAEFTHICLPSGDLQSGDPPGGGGSFQPVYRCFIGLI